MTQVPARFLPYPKVRYLNSTPKTIKTPSPRWNLDEIKFLSTGNSGSDIGYYLIQERGLKYGKTAPSAYESEFNEMMLQYNIGKPLALAPKGGQIINRLHVDDLSEQLHIAKKKGARIVILLLKVKNREAYMHFKNLADLLLGMQTICMTETANVKKGRFNTEEVTQYMGNIMMKVNLKLGGTNHDAVLEDNVSTSEKLADILVLVSNGYRYALFYCLSDTWKLIFVSRKATQIASIEPFPDWTHPKVLS
jgi:eukaryotic translation initiation factor 2C